MGLDSSQIGVLRESITPFDQAPDQDAGAPFAALVTARVPVWCWEPLQLVDVLHVRMLGQKLRHGESC